MTGKAVSLSTLWEALVRPHAEVAGVARQRRVRILASLSSILLVVSLALGLSALFAIGRLPLPVYVIVGTFAASYALSRTRWPEAGAGLLTFGLLLFGLIFLAAVPNPLIASQVMVFILLPALFSTLLLTAWYTIALALIGLLGLTLLIALAPWLSFAGVAVPYAATVLLSVLAAGASFFRERDVALIEQQTREVDRYSQQLQGDVRRIAAIAEVGRSITAARDLDALLKQVVELIVERFDYYHAQVFLVDESGRYAVLKQGTGPVGQELLARGHRLEVGSRSIIGQVTTQGEAVIASDTDVDTLHQRNELLPNTRSEMALPLRVGDRVIGALDIQSIHPAAFTETDLSVFQAMADQLAVAIENIRLFEQAQRDLEDIERLNRQLTGEAWRDYMSGRGASALGYRADRQGVRPLEPGDPAVQAGMARGGPLSLPLTVRGETIGMIDLEPHDGVLPDDETRRFLEVVAERVALALDSTRLSEQAQRQAAREQILSRLSAELQATTDLDVMLSIAVREASQALAAPHGFIHLTMKYGAQEG